ncbi:hypothetical protein SAMN05421829_108131 [Aromatoleum tolulyticum]|uniref:Uncharacterized protein n=1 Tax=Aromatoleum tolulyticum TaxID=34027 RepID=A0A1N6WZ96_9RHOO|nr:hypothetical protein SAMN05421829_108131 [Aromatoleum tolulyticum]
MSVSAQAVLVEIVRGTVQLPAIAAAVGGGSKAVVMAVQRLKRRGLVTAVATGEYAPTEAGRMFLAEGRQVASGQGKRLHTRTRGLRQRVWWVLRARGTVSLPDLLSTLSDGSERDACANLSAYLRALERAGFVAVLEQRHPGHTPTSNGYKRYRLVRNNGRQAPVVRQAHGVVFDPNSGETFAIRRGAA